jgi:hypothetical protein
VEEKIKLWIDNNIIFVEMTGSIDEKDGERLLRGLEYNFEMLSGNAKVVFNMGRINISLDAQTAAFRKKLFEWIKKMHRESKYEKVAIFGGNLVTRSVISLIIGATRLKDIRMFRDKNKALTWINQH